MAEMIAPKKKTRVKKPKVIDDIVPELPNLDSIEIYQNNTLNVKCDENLEKEIVDEAKTDSKLNDQTDTEIISEIHLDQKLNENPDTKLDNVKINALVEEMHDYTQMKDLVSNVTIQKLYPSLTQSLLSEEMVYPETNKNSLDIVTERITQPIAPIEEWRLPEPMSMAEMKIYYQNPLLENLKKCEIEFTQDMQSGTHPLADLITAYQRSVQLLYNLELKLKVLRDESRTKEQFLWEVVTKSERREARCRDNVLQSKSFTYEHATFNIEAAKQLEMQLKCFNEDMLDEHALLKYESGLNKALVDDYLVCVKSGHNNDLMIRLCLGVLFRFLRQLPVHKECTKALQDWILYLGSVIVSRGSNQERLYLFWELLHAPAGVSEWGSGLVQSDEVQLGVTFLAMLLGSKKVREDMLKAWNPGNNAEDVDWSLVDSDGEDDDNIGLSWSLLRESDLIAFLNQIPLGTIFRAALEVDKSRNEYDPGRSCHPGKLMNVMAFCKQIIDILNSGLDNYNNGRYKALNKRISRLIKHTVQFMTDHLEAVLGTSVLPKYENLFLNDTRFKMLAQYEAVYEYSLICVMKHRRHGNWQCLADFPWRLLSPQCKFRFLARLIDPDQSEPHKDNEWWLTNLQLVIDSVSQEDSHYLLTAISNLAIESRFIIQSESLLLTTITSLIFQICYVIPKTRSSFSKVGRELLSSLCLQHPQALSIIIESIKLWHLTVGQMGLFLFRELPFCLMIPSDTEFRLLSSWLLDNPPSSICNQLGRHVFNNLNWGFGNSNETILYLPLSLHQRMASLLVTSFKKHAMDSRPGPWLINESIRLVTSLWWNQDALQDQSFHAWCLSLSIRLRLHFSTRYKVTDQLCLQPSSTINSSDWIQAMSDAQQDRCSHPIAMYMAVTTWMDNQSVDNNVMKIIQNLMTRHQQYRLCLELLYQIIISSPTNQLTMFLKNDIFMSILKQIIHADDTYYNMVKSLVTKQFPGPVLACIGNSFCASVVMVSNDKDRQEALIKFFIHSVINQTNWYSDPSFLWILDKILEINVALDLKAGPEEMYSVVKQYTDKQFSDSAKRSGLAQIFRLGGSFTPLLNQLPSSDFMWLKSFIVEAQVQVEDDISLWSELLHKLFIRKKKDPRTVNQAMSSTCKHLHLGLNITISCLSIIQAVQLLATCPPDHLSVIKIAAVFFQRYLGLSKVWNKELIGVGSAGHRIFQDDALHPLLQQARATINAAKKHHEKQLDSFRQTNPTNVLTLDQMSSIRDQLDMLLLWIDEPRLHLEDMSVSGLPHQYRPDLLNLARVANLNIDSLGFPRRILLEKSRQSASLWDTRHDLDFRFLRLASSIFCKPEVPLSSRLLQRFKRQLSTPAILAPPNVLNNTIVIPPQALANSTQILEFISGPLSTMYQCAARQKANKNFLADLDRKYICALARQYEAHTVNQTVQIPCHRGTQGCTGQAVVNLNHQTWAKRADVITETSRNRQDYHQLIDDMIAFADLEQLVKGVVTVQHLITKIETQLQNCKNEEEFKKIVDFGFVLFFHLGRQINHETQKYPPHQIFVSQVMELLGSKFMKFGSGQSSVLLNGMLDNELLVDVYCPHFCPNSDTTQTSIMYIEVVMAYQNGKCNEHATCTILNKFNISHFLEFNPSIASKINMADSLLSAISYINPDKGSQKSMDGLIEEIHVNNLITMLSGNLSTCLPRVTDGFRSMCESGKLGARFWTIVARSLQDNINENGELILTIEEIRIELDNMGTWLNKCRFSDSLCKIHGLYIKFDAHASFIVELCGQLLESLVFKLTRSAKENVVRWQEVVEKIWDLFLKIYIPWIQSFFITDNHSQAELKLPWRVDDQKHAENIVTLAMERLNIILGYITNQESQSFLLHCVLIWIASGLLLLKELPIKPYHEVYCSKIKTLRWEQLKPTADCLKVIHELLSRPWMSEQSKAMAIDITSRLQFNDFNDDDFVEQLFELFVAIICKTKLVFKIEAVERLVDTFMDLNWNNLQIQCYRKGMEQLVACLEPRLILCNQSTIEGKVIKFLNHAAGCLTSNDKCTINTDQAIAKQTIYVNTVVKFLAIAFSFTQTKTSRGKSSGDDNQIKLFQLRICGLFCEIEHVTLQVSSREACQLMAISLLTEAVQLFRNQSITEQSIDPVIGWLQESRSSPLILPLLITIHKCDLQMSSLVRLTQELIETYILSDQSNGDPGCWATINGCIRLDPELQPQYLKDSIKQNCLLCLVQQLMVTIPKIELLPHAEQWQGRVVDWLEQTRHEKAEHSIIVLIFHYLKLLLVSSRNTVKPSSAFKNFIQVLLKLSESKTSSGFLGKVGLGRKSNFSIEFRMLCRSLSVFLHAQLPTNNMLRIRPNDPGAVTNPDMTISTRTVGEPLPTNKTLQNLEWLKSFPQNKEISPHSKAVLENNLSFICNPGHCIIDCVSFLRQMCQKLWPDSKLLNIIYY